MSKNEYNEGQRPPCRTIIPGSHLHDASKNSLLRWIEKLASRDVIVLG